MLPEQCEKSTEHFYLIMKATDFEVVVGGRISSSSTDYLVEQQLGEGAFGKVVQCRNVATDEMAALKVINSKSIQSAKKEAQILAKMKQLNSDNFNIIKWNGSFTYNGRLCLEFEKLDMNLYEFQLYISRPMALKEIRPVLQQLATGLQFLHRSGIVHADLKPENIMVVDRQDEPLRVKIIDFGKALEDTKMQTGETIQTLWYRAPEILLGVPFSEAIDVWSLGCIVTELFLAKPLLPGRTRYDMVRHILHAIGRPSDQLLNIGCYSPQFFKKIHREPSRWTFKPNKELNTPFTVHSLTDLLLTLPEHTDVYTAADHEERVSFVDLLQKMLKVDMSERITQSQILQHPFLTMTPLAETCSTSSLSKSSTDAQKLSPKAGEDLAPWAPQSCPSEFWSDFTKLSIQSDNNQGHSSKTQAVLQSCRSSVTDKESDECGGRTANPAAEKACVEAEPAGTSGPTLQTSTGDDADLCADENFESLAEKNKELDNKEQPASLEGPSSMIKPLNKKGGAKSSHKHCQEQQRRLKFKRAM